MSEASAAATAPPGVIPAPRGADATVHGSAEELYQQAPCGLLSILDDGTILGVNDSFLAWVGRRREDVLGTKFGRLLPVGDRILFSTHGIPTLQLVGVLEESAIDVVDVAGVRHPALLSARRAAATPDRPAVVQLAVFSARERRNYELELLAALRAAEASDAERRAAEAELHHATLHDGLTGLPNRAGLEAALATSLPGTGEGPRLAVLVIDLDNFKVVNDSLGHAAGNSLLTSVAARLRATLRAETTLARLSGDEFVVAFGGATKAEAVASATALATRLLEVLREPVTIESLEIVTSASIGVAVSEDADEVETLLRRADIAMYRAKAHGRGCWELHDPQQADPEVHRLRLLGDLRQGISRGELRVHYQPRVELATGALNGVESLVRWEHPTRGLVPPSEFIELAEETGLIVALGAFVLDEAVRQAVVWLLEAPHLPPVEVAVNVSARQLSDPGLVAMVSDALARHGLDPQLLTLEITETALMADSDSALAALTALKALGIRLSIDDFGTGYASFTYLKLFPVDELKIDKSFVDGLGAGTEDAAIIASCIALARAVGVRSVGEGVETEAQRVALVELGCDLAQGYLFGRPVLPDQLQR